MIASVRYTDASSAVAITMQDGAEWHTDAALPPDTEIRRALADWLAAGGKIAPFAPPLPDPIAIINAHVEAVARSMGYSSAASCAGYLNSTVPQWAAEAAAFVVWRDAVWVTVFARKDEPPPATADAVLALLPAWVPPRA